MLSGNDDLCKPDRHILRFLSEGLQREVKDTNEAQTIMLDAVAALKDRHSHLTVRIQDHTIWKYMLGRGNG